MVDEYIHEYIFSGSLPENASTYVKREADDELYQALQEGKFCYVLNARQSGKSSLRVRTMSRLCADGVECASIDLSSVSIQSATQENWYADLIVKLIDSFVLDVDFKDWWERNKLNSPLMRFSNFIEKHLLVEIEENIVIFIDEIDSVLSLNFPTDDFFAFIRACYNQRVDNPEYKRLTFCLLGVASPSNLIQDKNRTPFNIGQAISLKGFQLHEVEPLRRGLEEKFSNSQEVIEEILAWTGGQPFLTQKLCQFMIDEAESEKPRTVAEVVKSRIIENWESQDEPEHLRTIKFRILRDEKRAAYLLELYQQIWRAEVESEIIADDTIEQSELLLSGLVARREGKLRVYNRIYQQVFNHNWVEHELKNLRPYSEAFRGWIASGCSDESWLLQGNALVSAEKWANDKNLSYQDKQFLAASREKIIQEKIAAGKKQAELERERKDREAAEQRNKVLSEANKKAKQRIRNGSVILVLTLLGAAIVGLIVRKDVEYAEQKLADAEQKLADAIQKTADTQKEFLDAINKVEEARTKLEETYSYVAYPQQLKKLAKKLSFDSEKATKISKKADIKIKDAPLKQVFLHASKALAYQYLDDLKSAEESIKVSMQFLRGWENTKDKTTMIKSNNEFLQIKIFALSVQGYLFTKQNKIYQAREVYKEAFKILLKSKISPFKTDFYILDKNTVESLHHILIELLSVNKIQDNSQLNQVRKSLKNYYIDELDNLLSNKQWQEADRRTYQLMLYIANRIAHREKPEPGYFNLDSLIKFSCQSLKDIDLLWVKHSGRRFGFSVQKQIWKDTRNGTYNEASKRFASRIGWYDENKWYLQVKVIDKVEKDYQQAPIGTLPYWKNYQWGKDGRWGGFIFLRLSRCNS
ncbi:MAG: AAA-like domain-containing protein [Nostocaceae cyanobacterium]|nr:AAA-like domain-containing protein [Nostocaceae cyanobacterium]